MELNESYIRRKYDKLVDIWVIIKDKEELDEQGKDFVKRVFWESEGILCAFMWLHQLTSEQDEQIGFWIILFQELNDRVQELFYKHCEMHDSKELYERICG